MNFYKRHLGDYAKDAGHLTMLEHGAYTMLLDRYYATEAAIPQEDGYRVTRARSREERKATDAVLREFFTLDGDFYRSKRADQEIAKAVTQREVNREIGKRGGRPRRTEQEPNKNRIGFGNRTEIKTETEPIDNPSQTPDKRQEQEHSEPNGSGAPAIADALPRKLDSPPYQAIVDGYNRTMTGLAKVRVLTARRKRAIAAIWRDSPLAGRVELADAYWAECADDPFTSGRGPYTNGHEKWRPGFDYLIRLDVVTRIFEKAMDARERDQ